MLPRAGGGREASWLGEMTYMRASGGLSFSCAHLNPFLIDCKLIEVEHSCLDDVHRRQYREANVDSIAPLGVQHHNHLLPIDGLLQRGQDRWGQESKGLPSRKHNGQNELIRDLVISQTHTPSITVPAKSPSCRYTSSAEGSGGSA